MSNSKRKHKHFSGEDGEASSPSPLAKHSRKSTLHVGKAPQSNTSQTSRTPAQALKHQEDRSDSPSPSSRENIRCAYLRFDNTQQIRANKHNSMPPPLSTARGDSRNHDFTTSQKQLGKDSHHSKRQSTPTVIRPPQDHLPDFMAAMKAQNRRRSEQHQTFTANMPVDTDLDLEIPSSVKGSSNDDGRSIEDIEPNEAEIVMTSSGSTPSTTSDSASDQTSGSDEGTDSDSEDSASKQSKGSQETGSLQHPKQGKHKVKPALMGRELVEEMARKEKERMGKAAQRAISTLKTKSKPKTAALNTTDQKALKSLHNLIPEHILTQTRNNLKATNPPNPNPANLTLTLHASRTLILQLSNTKLNITTSRPFDLSATTTTQPDERVQTELLRIAKDRAQQIETLELEVTRLKAEVTANETGESKTIKKEKKKKKKKRHAKEG